MHLNRHRLDGFTLLEVLVSLLIGTFLVMGARDLLGSVSDGARRLESESRSIDRRLNGELTLRTLVRTLHAGIAHEDTTVGGPDSVVFTSWCEVPEGWQERCRVTIGLRDTTGGRAVHVSTGAGWSFDVQWSGITGPLLYLWQSGEDRAWRSNWISMSRPAAIGIVRHIDTLLLPIGVR